MGKADRRARKKERRDAGLVDGIRADLVSAYLASRYVCDRCGLDQPVNLDKDIASGEVAPCIGFPALPELGLPELFCAGETARMLDSYMAS